MTMLTDRITQLVQDSLVVGEQYIIRVSNDVSLIGRLETMRQVNNYCVRGLYCDKSKGRMEVRYNSIIAFALLDIRKVQQLTISLDAYTLTHMEGLI